MREIYSTGPWGEEAYDLMEKFRQGAPLTKAEQVEVSYWAASDPAFA